MQDVTKYITEYALNVIKGYCIDPDAISCETSIESNVLKLTITSTSKGNASRVIGKGGRNIKSIRDVVRVVYATHGGKYHLSIRIIEDKDIPEAQTNEKEDIQSDK